MLRLSRDFTITIMIDLKESDLAICKYLAPVLLAPVPAAATAQTIDEQMVNGYFAQVTLIEDHAQCDGAGETAFELSLDAQDMEFNLRGVDGDSIAYVGYPQSWNDAGRERCYLTESRGTKRTQFEIPCNASLTQAELQAKMEQLSVSLNFSGTLAICQSPTDKKLLDGSWTATLEVDGQQSSYDGEYAVSTEHYCRRSDDAPGTRVAVTYANSGLLAREDGPFERAAGAYHLRILDMPIEIPDANGIAVDLRTGATFFPVFEGAVECPKEGCGDHGVWGISDIGPYVWRDRHCG